jgi:hypothetical protein
MGSLNLKTIVLICFLKSYLLPLRCKKSSVGTMDDLCHTVCKLISDNYSYRRADS